MMYLAHLNIWLINRELDIFGAIDRLLIIFLLKFLWGHDVI